MRGGVSIDLTGQVFGRLTVIKMLDPIKRPSGSLRYKCLCRCDCGTEKSVDVNALKRGATKSCGCYNAEATHKRSFMDLTGQNFGDLTVIYQAESKIRSGKARTVWHCKCACGGESDVLAVDLRSGKCKSCGCKQYSIAGHNFRDLQGQTFGNLTVLHRADDRVKASGGHVVRWRCKCICGSIKDVDADNLVYGHTKSCGCIRSFGEETIAKLLSEQKIKYLRNHQYTDLISSKGAHLSFDFALLDSADNIVALVEYQGQQHYLSDDEIGSFGKLQRDETDDAKKKYCVLHHIKLYEIKYNDIIEIKLNQIIEEVYGNTVPSVA